MYQEICFRKQDACFLLNQETYLLIHDKKQMGIEIKFYNLDTFKKQVDANCIDLDSEFGDLNYKVTSLIFCHFWRRIHTGMKSDTILAVVDRNVAIFTTSHAITRHEFQVSQGKL